MTELYVEQVMATPVETVESTVVLSDAAGELLSHNVGALVVVEDGDLHGILTATDFVRFVDTAKSISDTVVGDVMRQDVVTTTPDTPLSEVTTTMLDQHINHVPVLDREDALVGMLSTTDIAAQMRGGR